MGDKLSNDEYSEFRSKIVTLKEKYKKDPEVRVTFHTGYIKRFMGVKKVCHSKKLFDE